MLRHGRGRDEGRGGAAAGGLDGVGGGRHRRGHPLLPGVCGARFGRWFGRCGASARRCWCWWIIRSSTCDLRASPPASAFRFCSISRRRRGRGGAGRVKKIRRRVSRLAVILPFERAFFEQHGIAGGLRRSSAGRGRRAMGERERRTTVARALAQKQDRAAAARQPARRGRAAAAGVFAARRRG